MENMTFIPDKESSVPLYRQLYSVLVAEIQSGHVQTGEKLPSKRSLAARLHFSLSTVETAYSMLLAEGYLAARPRSGYFVCAAEEPLAPPRREILSPPPEKKPPLLCFSTNEVDADSFPYATWARLAKSAASEEQKFLHPGEAQGDYGLRRVLSKTLYEMRGVLCTPEQIIIGAGVEYLLDLVVQLLGPEQIYGLENPGYRKIAEILRNNGRAMRMIPLDQQGMQADKLRKSDATVAYVTPSHQFPMGVTMPYSRRMQLLKWARERNGYLIEDDYDSEFRYSTRPIPALQSFDRHERVLYLGTFSRSIAPSIRAAYLVLPLSLLPVYHEKFCHYSSTVSRMEQLTLTRFLEEGHFARHLRRMTLCYKKKEERLLSLLSHSALGPSMAVQGEHAGLHFLLLPGGKQTEQQLLSAAEKRGLLLHGLSEYCSENLKFPSPALVLGYAGMGDAEMQKGVALLEQAWLEG